MADPGIHEKGGSGMNRRRWLRGRAYLEFLLQYLALFPPRKKREKITGKFVF